MSDNGEFYFPCPNADGSYPKLTHTFYGMRTHTEDGYPFFEKSLNDDTTFQLTEGQYRSAKAKMQKVVNTLTEELKALLLLVVPTANPNWTFFQQIHHMWTATSVPETTQTEVWTLYFDKLQMLQGSLDAFHPSSSRYE